MKTILYRVATPLLIVVATACHKPVSDPVPDLKPIVSTWKNVDSLFNANYKQNRTIEGVYADSTGIAFVTPFGFVYYRKDSRQPHSFFYRRADYSLPTFYRGVAWVRTSDHTIQSFPYDRPGTASTVVRITDLDLPPLFYPGKLPTFQHSPYSYNVPICINTEGLMMFKVENGPYHQLYLLPLDANGNPMVSRNQRVTTGTLPDGGELIYDAFTFESQLFIRSLRGYDKVDSTRSFSTTVIGELQHVWPAGKVQTALPHVRVFNMFARKKSLYVIGSRDGFGSFMYKSTNNGTTWTELYKIEGDMRYFSSQVMRYYSIEGRTVFTVGGGIAELDPDTGQTRALSMTGFPDWPITGLAEYNTDVYLTSETGGIFRKPLTEFW